MYTEIAGTLKAEDVDFAVLKGFAFCPDFMPSPEWRVQYDIDLLFRQDSVFRARDVVAQLGYEPIRSSERFPVDHLPSMIRKTGWEWRGDYFDPEIPLSVELHYRLWDPATEGFDVPAINAFWSRTETRSAHGFCFRTLDRADTVAYGCLHILRHLFRGNLRPSHVYELAAFLNRTAGDERFWQTWDAQHPGDLRRLQATCFALASAWFDCSIAGPARQEIARLPGPTSRWIAEFGTSPLTGLFHPNKDELWLHVALLSSFRSKARVFRRRLLPAQLPGPVDALYVPDEQLTLSRRIQRARRYTAFISKRLLYHLRAVPAVAASGLHWATGLSGEFWRFFIAAALFDVGLFVFFLLYNIYLLRLGFNEQFLGFLRSALTIGSIAGSLSAALVLSRWGVRRCLIVCISVLAIASALRAAVLYPPALVALAGIAGACTGVWAVALAPTVADLTSEAARPLAFSLIFGEGIGLGVIAGVAGGRLPELFSRVTTSQLAAFRGSLLAGCAIVLGSVFALMRLTVSQPPQQPRVFRKPSGMLLRFLFATAVWHLATGAFNPFFNAFFVRLRVPIPQIGMLFSASQLAQTLVVLAAPALLRAVGLIRGVALMQAMTAVALVFIAISPSVNTAATAYVLYMAFQYMSEPGIFTFLMNATPLEERTTTSALNFVIAFGAQALASAVAGTLIARTGYSSVLISASVLCAIAALLFFVLLRAPEQHES